VLKSRGNVEEFKKEFLIISSIQSSHIVRFFGACLSPQIAMVMEYCARGSLQDLMQDESMVVGWNYLFNWSIQMCGAVHTLHTWTPSILHRDLKSGNLLVNEKYEVLLADFGLSRFETESNAATLNKTCGTVTHCAPEILSGVCKYTAQCDMYSVAMILWELTLRVLKGKYTRPYEEFPDMIRDIQFLKPVCDDHLRPSLPKECPNELVKLIQIGWNHKGEIRPTAEEMSHRLKEIQQIYKENMSTWDSIPKANK